MTGYNFYLKKVLLGQIGGIVWITDSFSRQVAASADDIGVYKGTSAWGIQLTRTGEPMGRNSATLKRWGAGMRWLNVTIPKGATILTAHVHLIAFDTTTLVGINARIVGDLEANAAAFSTLADYQARRGTSCDGADNTKRTVEQVDYAPETNWTQNVEYTTPDITLVIQEIVNQASWVSGNALALFIDDHDDRTLSDNLERDSFSFNGSAAKAPTLHTTYKYIA